MTKKPIAMENQNQRNKEGTGRGIAAGLKFSPYRRGIQLILLIVILMWIITGCSLLGQNHGTAGNPGENPSAGTPQRAEKENNPDGDSNQGDSQGNNQTENEGNATEDEGTLGDSLEKEYPWLTSLKEEDQREIRKILTHPLIKNAPPIPENLSDLLAYPPGRLAGLDPQKDESEFPITAALLPVFRPYDDDRDWGDPTEGEIATATIRERYARALLSLTMERFPRPEEIYKDFVKPALPAGEIKAGEYGEVPYRAQTNVEIILDASGSMKEKIGGKTKMELAKEAIQSFLGELPKGVNLSLRLFGHKEAPTKEDACQVSELVYPLGPYKAEEFGKAMEVTPSGWTNLAYTIQQAGEDLKGYQGESYTNIVVIVSDGAETCGGDPIKEAEALKKSEIQPYFHLIGFNADPKGKEQLSAIAKAVGGLYRDAQDAEGLKNELKPLGEWISGWDQWRKNALEAAKTHRKEMADRIAKMEQEWDTKAERLIGNIRELNDLAGKKEKIGVLAGRIYVRDTIYDTSPSSITFERELNNLKSLYFQALITKLDQDYANIIEEIDQTYEAQKEGEKK
ncbi:MAG: VWA domain-containing protein [Thermicanus sp.]|nr:VWA domain-containing protein [Thermicanus sp.]